MAKEAGLDVANSFDVYKLAQSGDAAALSVFEKMGRYLGITLAGLVNLLNPEMIIIGGGAAASWDAFIDHVRSELHARAFDELLEFHDRTAQDRDAAPCLDHEQMRASDVVLLNHPVAGGKPTGKAFRVQSRTRLLNEAGRAGSGHRAMDLRQSVAHFRRKSTK